MSKRYLTLGTDVLDTQGYDVIATAKSDALAQHIAEEMNKAAELEQVKGERDAMREAIGNLFIVIGNHTGGEIKCDTITEKKWIAKAAALKDARQ